MHLLNSLNLKTCVYYTWDRLIEIKELLLHEEVHHYLRPGGSPVVDTYVNVVVHLKRDHFTK